VKSELDKVVSETSSVDIVNHLKVE